MSTPFLTLAALAVDSTAATEPELNIDSIKALMDGFDPASLLPDLSKIFGSLVGVCRFAVMIGPIVLLILGLAYLFLAPKEANYYFGYRCYYGMGSVHAWRYAQRLAGLGHSILGLVLILIMAFSTGGFASMEVTDMVWKAVNCLIWEAVLVVLMTLAINLTVAAFFDRKGEFRNRKPAAKRKEKPQHN